MGLGRGFDGAQSEEVSGLARGATGHAMRITHLTGSISRAAGGPAVSVRRTVQELAVAGCCVHVVALKDQDSEVDRLEYLPIRADLIEALPPRRMGLSAGWAARLEEFSPDLVHVNGIWLGCSRAAYTWGRRTRTPYVVSPRGMLEPWALAYHKWRKRVLWLTWERRVLEEAEVLHATSEREADGFRRLGLRNPIAIVGNGVDEPPDCTGRQDRGDERTAVFLGRLHPIKGLPLLLGAWSGTRPRGWRLVIAGPDECGHAAAMRKLTRELGVDDVVEFVGPVYGMEKWRLLTGADLFVLPTYSENFGVAVAESLACGVPVITTTGAPWRVIMEERCGWWVEPNIEALASALRKATTLPDEQRREMGERGRSLMAERFGWPAVAQQVREVYEWVLGRGPRPACVVE